MSAADEHDPNCVGCLMLWFVVRAERAEASLGRLGFDFKGRPLPPAADPERSNR